MNESTSRKIRLDRALLLSNLASDLRQAQGLILSGQVLVNDEPQDKVGFLIQTSATIRLKKQPKDYVSRGGEKLKGALQDFSLSLQDKVILDLGASTGGFTDCSLKEGAKQVYAVDVGSNQLAYALRLDPRVSVFEEYHIKDLSKLDLDPSPDVILMDLSFISTASVLHFLKPLFKPNLELLVLVKPQFELERSAIESGGIVSSVVAQEDAVERVRAAASSLGLNFLGSRKSVIKGAKKGNQEWFALFRLEPSA